MGADEGPVATPAGVEALAAKVATVSMGQDVAKASDAGTKLNITTGKAEYILPTEPREPQIYFLTNLDQNVAMIVKTVYLYEAKPECKEDPTHVLKTSLAKVLNHYWPLAGRLSLSAEMKLVVDYANQGACFAEAIADAELKDLGDVSRPSEQLAQLLYQLPEWTNILDTPCLIAQVTKFRCGGWTLGLAMQHSIFDGIGANEFLKLWGETARGVPMSMTPVLDRSILKARSPPKPEFPHHEFEEIQDISKDDRLNTSEDVVDRLYCFEPEDVDELKKKVMADGEIKKCTTFEVLTALIWRARTRAMEMEPEQKTRIYFAVNGREKFDPPLPEGYVGNAIVLTYCMTTSADLIEHPLSYSVKLVQDAIKLIDDKYMRSAIDYFELTRARPAMTASFIITTWSRLPFHTSDFGWGEAVQNGPVNSLGNEVALFLSHGKDRKSINVLLGLPRKIVEKFEEAMKL